MQELENRNTEDENVNEDLQSAPEITDTPPVPDSSEVQKEADGESVDYAQVAKEDLIALKSEFPELEAVRDISELNNPLRYAALRDLGLTPSEAYLATAKRVPKRDNRSHLSAIGTASYSQQSTMNDAEMAAARELFSDISDAEIRKLYKKVTK